MHKLGFWNVAARWGRAAALVAGLGMGGGVQAQAQASEPARGYEILRWNPAAPVPALRVTDTQGRVWSLEALRGKVLLINFWASWCEPCREEMPSLQALARSGAGPAPLVLTVNYKEGAGVVQQFVQRTRMDLPVVLDPQGDVARLWSIKIFPSTVVIGPNGKVRAVVRGALDWTRSDALALLQPLY